MNRTQPLLFTAAVGLGASMTLARLARRARRIDLGGRVVVITGGGRGLGYAIAQELVRRGSRIAICGRDAAEIERAAAALREAGGDVYGAACDAADAQAVEHFVGEVMKCFGRIDVLVNNAGQCFVGPAAALRDADVESAMRNIFWVQVRPTLAVLPHMRQRRFGRIVNVASIGGKLPLPHQAAYAPSKFAVVGGSESIATELARDGIHVSTVAPPPLRDGAALFAHFQGRREQEFRWFTLALRSPIAIEATRAALAVADAAERGDIERTVAWQSWLPSRAYGLAPGAMTRALGLFARLLPAPATEDGSERRLGHEVVRDGESDLVRALGERARERAARYRPDSASGQGMLAPAPHARALAPSRRRPPRLAP
jgi:NAD(P)-dependent dehydrogenase (short-subunit alcohol dehydrogenase family)